MFMVFATSLVVFLYLCYCRYFDETFTELLFLNEWKRNNGCGNLSMTKSSRKNGRGSMSVPLASRAASPPTELPHLDTHKDSLRAQPISLICVWYSFVHVVRSED